MTEFRVAVGQQSLSVNMVTRPQLQLKVLPRYPSLLSASSPIKMASIDGSLNFSFDAAASAPSIAPYLTPYYPTEAPADGFTYGRKDLAWLKVAPLNSPNLTGTPTTPTPAVDTSTTQIATTAYVIGQASSAGDGTPAMDGAAARGASTHFARADHVHPTDTSRAPLASPVLTGDPTAPTPAVDDNDTSIATTAYVIGQASAVGDGTPAMDGAAARGASTHFARADHVHPTDTSRAPLASPGFSGTPTAPTAAVDTNTTQIASTAFVLGQASAVADGNPAMDGAAARGASTHFARADHVHPVDTSRMGTAGNQNITGGFTFTPNNIGTVSTGTLTPNPALGNYQYYTNNGAHTLAAPASDCAMDILCTNGATAGAITFSGFTVAAGNTGDALTTTNTSKFIISIRRINAVATYTIKALQ